MALPRIAILTPDFPPAQGGIQRYIHELARGLAPRWEVTVVAPRASQGRQSEPEEPFTLLRTRGAWGGAGSGAVLGEMGMAARRARPRVILAGHLACLPAAAAAAGRRPVASLVYGGELWSSRTRRVVRLAAGRLRRTLCISDFTAEEARRAGAPPESIRLAQPGASLAPPPADAVDRLTRLGLVGGGEAAPFLLSIGRLAEPYKGEDVLIRALPALVARRPDLRYVIAGEGPLGDHLRRLAEGVGVADAVLMPGAIDEQTKTALLSGCAALVMLSRASRATGQFEGFGIAYIEAALAGRPSLAGDSGGVRDAVIDGETGAVVDPRDPVAIVEAAERLLDEPDWADSLGASGRVRAQAEFTWEHAVARVESALAELL